MKYQCPRCDYISDDYRNTKRHISRETLCTDVHNNNIVPSESNIIKLPDEKVTCDICDKEFSSKRSLKSHSLICIVSPEKYKQIISELRQKNEELVLQLKTITNTNNNTNGVVINNNSIDNSINNNVSIFINNYKDTTTKHISHSEIMYCMKRCMMAVPYMIEKIHFDKNVPENHNVCISNHKEKKALIKQNGEWISKNGRELVSSIYNDCHFKMFHQFSENPEMQALYPELEKIYENYTNITDGNEEKIYEYVTEVLYNNKQLCLDAKKKSEE